MNKYKIPLIKNSFYNARLAKEKLSSFVLRSDRFSMGKYCEEFEELFSDFQGKKFTILFNSGSSANLALIQALRNLGILKPNDLIGFTAIGWPTTIMPLIQLGLKPIPIDVNTAYINSTVNEIEKTQKVLRAQGQKLRAVFLTNVLGFSGNIKEISDFCKKNKIILLEDNCESLGSEYMGKKLGNYGLASTYSFFVGHHFSCIEGGAVCTNSKELSDMLKMVRSHGWDRNLDSVTQNKLRTKHRVSEFDAKYTFYTIGMNLRPTEITGFLGTTQLPLLNEIIHKRHGNFISFFKAIEGKKHKIVDIYSNKNLNINSNFAFPIVMKTKEEFINAKNIFEKRRIEIRPIIGGNLSEQPFFKSYRMREIKVPNTKFITSHGFYFGNDPSYTIPEIKYIQDTIKQI